MLAELRQKSQTTIPKEIVEQLTDNDIIEKLRFEAEKDDRSLSQYINIVLKEHIREIENKK